MKTLNLEQTKKLLGAARDAGRAMYEIMEICDCTEEKAIELIKAQHDIYTDYQVAKAEANEEIMQG